MRIAFQKIDFSNGTTYYRLWSTRTCKTLLEFEIQRDGRRIDYLKLERFWGYVPRPLQ